MDTKQTIELQQLLTNLWEYMDNKSDSDHNGDNFVPNKEMILELEINKFLNILANEY